MTDAERKHIREQYTELVSFYWEVKKVVATCEKIDEEQRAPIVAIAELRSVLDHIMRVENVLLGLKSASEVEEETGQSASDYCVANLDKAVGHLFRAGYDAYDIIAIAVDQEIRSLMSEISYEALYHVAPDVAQKLPAINEARFELADVKVEKDVEGPSQDKRQYARCECAIRTLVDFRDLLQERLPLMLEYDADRQQGKRVNWLWTLLISLGASAIVGFATYYLSAN